MDNRKNNNMKQRKHSKKSYYFVLLAPILIIILAILFFNIFSSSNKFVFPTQPTGTPSYQPIKYKIVHGYKVPSAPSYVIVNGQRYNLITYTQQNKIVNKAISVTTSWIQDSWCTPLAHNPKSATITVPVLPGDVIPSPRYGGVDLNGPRGTLNLSTAASIVPNYATTVHSILGYCQYYYNYPRIVSQVQLNTWGRYLPPYTCGCMAFTAHIRPQYGKIDVINVPTALEASYYLYGPNLSLHRTIFVQANLQFVIYQNKQYLYSINNYAYYMLNNSLLSPRWILSGNEHFNADSHYIGSGVNLPPKLYY